MNNKTSIQTQQLKKSFLPQILVGLLSCASTALAVDVAPPASSVHRLVYDTARQEGVLFGLWLASGNTTQTWVWNGKWSLKSPAASPPGVKAGALAYDEARQEAVFYGGILNGLNSTWTNNNATWLWNGTNWSPTTPTVKPPSRFGAAMTYDSLHTNVVLFGGDLRTSSAVLPVCTNDTWVWNGLDWTLKNPANRPSVRDAFGLAFDAARGQTVLFGGITNAGGGGDLNDTWIWDGTNWIQKSPANHPPALHVSGMAYDSIRQEVVLFGGLPKTGGYNETWTWNGTNWFQKNPTLKPAQRVEHSLAFDPARGKAVLFGGDVLTGWLADTWLWDGTNWSSSDMTLSLAALPPTVFVGSNLTYSVTVTNKGPSLAEEVKLVEELPGSVGFISASASQGSCSYAGGVVTCNLGSVPVGTNIAVTLVVTPLALGTITNTTTVLCSAELNPSNNIVKAVTTVVSPPIVNTPLTNQTVSAGGQIILNLGVTGSAPLTYQWYFGTNLVAQTTSLSLTNLDWSQAGFYTVVVGNPYGSVTNTAILSVNDLHMYAGIRIGGAQGASYRIEARNSLSTNDTWLTLTNFALPYSPFLFIDEDSPNHPQRFYQVTAP